MKIQNISFLKCCGFWHFSGRWMNAPIPNTLFSHFSLTFHLDHYCALAWMLWEKKKSITLSNQPWCSHSDPARLLLLGRCVTRKPWNAASASSSPFCNTNICQYLSGWGWFTRLHSSCPELTLSDCTRWLILTGAEKAGSDGWEEGKEQDNYRWAFVFTSGNHRTLGKNWSPVLTPYAGVEGLIT